MNNSIIRTRNVSKTYNGSVIPTQALRDVSIDIPKGAFTAIVGPSGHGKSTLMHIIGGLDRPTEGAAFISDREISSMSHAEVARLRSERIGFVFQFFNLLQNLTALENVETAMMLARVPEQDQRIRARILLETVGLGEKADAKPGQLSGGQQQRVAVARALANNPDILLLDEPTGNLDSGAEAGIMELLQALHQKGKTLVVVTHNADIARKADHVITIRDGMAVLTE